MEAIERSAQWYWGVFDRASGLDSLATAHDDGHPASAPDALAAMVRRPRDWQRLLAGIQDANAWAVQADAQGLAEPEAIVLSLLLARQDIVPAALPAAVGCWYRSVVLLDGRGGAKVALAKHAGRILLAALRAASEPAVRSAVIAEAEVAFERAMSELRQEGVHLAREVRAGHASLIAGVCGPFLSAMAWDQVLMLMASVWLATGRPEALAQGVAAAAASFGGGDGASEIPWAEWFSRARWGAPGGGPSDISELGGWAMARTSLAEDRTAIARSAMEAMWLSIRGASE
jgi:hypothetical protein